MVSKIEYSEAFTEEIYLVLADFSWLSFRKSKFSNYFEWATYIKKCIGAGKIDPVKIYIYQISQESSKFFGFSEEELFKFSMEFFLFEKYQEYYEHIRLFRAIYGGYIIKKKIIKN